MKIASALLVASIGALVLCPLAHAQPYYDPGRMSRIELGVHHLLNCDVDRALGIGDTKLHEL